MYIHARTHTSFCVAVKYGLSFLSSKPDQRGSHQGQTIFLSCGQTHRGGGIDKKSPFHLVRGQFVSLFSNLKVRLMIVRVTNGLHWHISNILHCLTALARQRLVQFGVPQGGPLGPLMLLVQPHLYISEHSLFSGPLQVFVLLAQDGHLVLEENGVQAKLGVDQRHVAKPVGERVDALLPLVEVLRIGPRDTLGTLTDGTNAWLSNTKARRGRSKRASGWYKTYLRTGQLFVLLPLGDFDRWQVRHSRDQEVHQDVLTVGGAIYQSAQRLGQVMGEQVVVVPVGRSESWLSIHVTAITSLNLQPDIKDGGFFQTLLHPNGHQEVRGSKAWD